MKFPTALVYTTAWIWRLLSTALPSLRPGYCTGLPPGGRDMLVRIQKFNYEINGKIIAAFHRFLTIFDILWKTTVSVAVKAMDEDFERVGRVKVGRTQ